jgi:hypothetical protein
MSLQHIRTAVDPEQILKGDVVIIKRTYASFAGSGQHRTKCTKCGNLFPTEYRRMAKSGKRQLEVRNIPQCRPCRSRYHAERRFKKALLADIDEHNARALPAPSLPRLENWSIYGYYAEGILRGKHPTSTWLFDGDRVATSAILSRQKDTTGRETITTKNGTVYELGVPA